MNGHCWILGPHPNPMIASCSFWPDLTLVQPCFSIASRFSMISLKLPPLLQIRQPYICPLSVNLWDFLPPRNWIHFPVQNVRWLQASKITQPRSLPDNSRPKIQCVREREVKWPQPAPATRLDFPGIPRGPCLALLLLRKKSEKHFTHIDGSNLTAGVLLLQSWAQTEMEEAFSYYTITYPSSSLGSRLFQPKHLFRKSPLEN